jgi:hypothetical protein
MSRTLEALKRAEKERIARKEEQLRVLSKKSAIKKIAYLILITFMLMILGLFSFWADRTGYLNNITAVFKETPRNIVTEDPPANVQSHAVTSEVLLGMQVHDLFQDAMQQMKVPSRSEKSAIPIPQKLNKTQRAENRKGDVVPDKRLDTGNSTDLSRRNADRPPDPAKRDQNGSTHPLQKSRKTSDPLISPGLTAESKSIGQNSMAPVIKVTPPVDEKEKTPDPGVLIDWVLKKRSIQNE